MSPSRHTSIPVTVRMVVFTCAFAPQKEAKSCCPIRYEVASYLHPVYSDRNRCISALSEPEICGSGCGIHMFFRCRSSGDGNSVLLLRRAEYGYLPEAAGSVHKKSFLPGCVCQCQILPHFPWHEHLHLYGLHR